MAGQGGSGEAALVLSSRRRAVSPITSSDIAAVSPTIRSARKSSSANRSTQALTNEMRSAIATRRRGSSSGIDCVAEGCISHIGRESRFGHQFHGDPQPRRVLILQRELAKSQRTFDIGDQVDITIGPRFVPCMRPEDAKARHTLTRKPGPERRRSDETFIAGRRFSLSHRLLAVFASRVRFTASHFIGNANLVIRPAAPASSEN